jgi:hypothetical protein
MTTRLRRANAQGQKTVAKVIGAELELSSTGYAQVFINDLEALGLRMQDMEPVFDLFGRYIVEQHIPRQFAAHGTPARWAPLSPEYAAWKARHFPGRPILVRSGAMRAGFTWEAHPRSLRIINRVTAGQRSRTPRWVFHQEGTDHMPARPMVQISTADRTRLRQFAAQHLFVEGGIE